MSTMVHLGAISRAPLSIILGILAFLSIIYQAHPASQADDYSYCEAEVFKPTCPNQDEVVVMLAAFYGRMRLGKCVQTDYGYVGCQADALHHMDAKCSGRRTCTVGLPDKSLDVINTCPKEFKTYLEANYTCVKVENTQCDLCQTTNNAKLTGESGRIASILTEEHNSGTRGMGCGSARCPWLIQVRQGQKINLTLYDFSTESSSTYNTDGCFRYAVVKEKVEGGIKSHPVCTGKKRISHLLTSISNEVEIHIVSPEVFANKGQFIIKYDAIGCPDIAPPNNAYFTRDTRDRNAATVGCVNTDAKLVIKCLGTQWDGDIPECPGETGTIIDSSSALTLPLGVLVAIIIGIALIIGVLILTIGLICLRSFFHRQQGANFRRPDTSSIYGRSRRSSEYHEEMSAATPLQYSIKKERLPEIPTEKVAFNPNIRENVYMESRPLPSIPDVEDDKSDKSSKVQVYRTSSGREHYHNPRLVVNTRDPRGGPLVECDPCDPQYFVLDPDEFVMEEAPCPSTSGTMCVRGGVQSDKQKSPEEENAENFCKEVLNNSCHEIPLRAAPPVPVTHTCCHPGEDNREGNSSWP